MAEHVLKTVEPYFTAVKLGIKTFEARRNDRAYQAGDTLILRDPAACQCDSTSCEKRLIGALHKTVTFVFSGDPNLRDLGGIVPGYVVLAFADREEGGR